VLNIATACQTCHPWGEDELRDRVETIQTRLFNARDRTLDALIDLIEDIQEAVAAGAPEESLAAARAFQRRAQFYLDFVEAENSTGFHAPQEATRILVDAVDYVRQGQNALP
jgi:nitrite reductase (cytochrome c-552)